MSKALITNSYFYRLDPKQWKFRQPYPPLGTLQAAAVIRNMGIETHFFDSSLTEGPEAIQPLVQQHLPDYFILYEDGFNYLTKMCLTVMREAAFKMATQARQRGCVVIVNSSDATDHCEKYFDHGVDFVLRGEGEETLRVLLSALEEGKDVSDIDGLAGRRNGVTFANPGRQVIRELDSLPLPAWDLVDLSPYRRMWSAGPGYFSLNIATTRGCPYKCNWCAKPIYGNRYNSRSPHHVVQEIQLLLQRFEPDHFWMCDDIFGLKPRWVAQFRDLVVEKKLKFRYKIQSRADLLLEDGFVRALAESGCETVWLGAESGSQKILDAMEKGTTVAQIREATRMLKLHGIGVAYFLQFGYPGETKQDIDATLDLVLDQMPHEIGISVSYPLPGTRFFDLVKSQLAQKQNWTDSDDLALLYRSTYPMPYYKILQRYVHSRYRIERGLRRLTELIRKPGMQKDDLRKMASMIYHVPLSLYQNFRLNRLSAPHG